MKRALIIGIDSTISSYLQQELIGEGWEVLGTTRQLNQIRDNVFYLDLFNLSNFSFDLNIDTVFMCASMTNIAVCQANPEECYTINFHAQIKLAEYFLTQKAHIIFLSTSAVFSGEKPYYKINDLTCPTTLYGISKAEAEKKLSSLSKEITIVRLSKVLTPEYPLFQHWITQLRADKPIEPFKDLYLCPISIKTVIRCLKEIAEKKYAGFIHLSGTEDISYQMIAEYFISKMNIQSSLIKPKSVLGLSIQAPRYSSLDMEQNKNILNNTDFSVPTLLNDLYGTPLNDVTQSTPI